MIRIETHVLAGQWKAATDTTNYYSLRRNLGQLRFRADTGLLGRYEILGPHGGLLAWAFAGTDNSGEATISSEAMDGWIAVETTNLLTAAEHYESLQSDMGNYLRGIAEVTRYAAPFLMEVWNEIERSWLHHTGGPTITVTPDVNEHLTGRGFLPHPVTLLTQAANPIPESVREFRLIPRGPGPEFVHVFEVRNSSGAVVAWITPEREASVGTMTWAVPPVAHLTEALLRMAQTEQRRLLLAAAFEAAAIESISGWQSAVAL